jgi:hypothetical protein
MGKSARGRSRQRRDKGFGEVLRGNGEVCQTSPFSAKKCEPKCESSLRKCESHLPKLWIGVPIRQESVNRCESMAKSFGVGGCALAGDHRSRFTAGFENSHDFS